MSGAAGTVTGYTGTFHGRADQMRRVRAGVAEYLTDCPVAEDAVLVAELASNAVLHSRSRGEFIRIRCQVSPGLVRIEVEDLGGPWRTRQDDDRPHGLDIVEALAGRDGWGAEITPD